MMPSTVTNVDANFIMTKVLISIVGPTAIGKTALSIKLAQHFKTEIISADSRQFYKEMSIGTAVPSKEELRAAKHHFIQHISIKDSYSVGDFERDAISRIKAIHKTKDVAIMVGGSGLYVKAVTKGLDDFPEINENIRLELNKELDDNGLESLQKRLRHLDPKTYEAIALDNPQRVLRALEVCIGTGQPYSSFLTNPDKSRPFKTVTVGLNTERAIIYERINQRVDIMVKNGLIDEVEALLKYKNLNALNTVGYKELFKYFEKEWTLDFAISEIKKNSRRFAKRQLTWFRKNESIKWFDFNYDIKAITNYIKEEL
jgi:tRNA dimethylallyltransferase